MKNGIMEGMESGSGSTSGSGSEEKKEEKKEEKNEEKKEEKKEEIKDADSAKKEDFEVGRRKNGASKIDYASTIEDAYDDLNKILGSDGIKRLTNDTQGLMKQQMELAESMKAMTPLVQGMAPMIEQMKSMMTTMDADGEGGLAGVMDMAKKLTGSMSTTK
jgi:hypothetical protein